MLRQLKRFYYGLVRSLYFILDSGALPARVTRRGEEKDPEEEEEEEARRKVKEKCWAIFSKQGLLKGV